MSYKLYANPKRLTDNSLSLNAFILKLQMYAFTTEQQGAKR